MNHGTQRWGMHFLRPRGDRPYSGDEVRDVDVDRMQRPPLKPVELLQRGEGEGEAEAEGEGLGLGLGLW